MPGRADRDVAHSWMNEARSDPDDENVFCLELEAPPLSKRGGSDRGGGRDASEVRSGLGSSSMPRIVQIDGGLWTARRSRHHRPPQYGQHSSVKMAALNRKLPP